MLTADIMFATRRCRHTTWSAGVELSRLRAKSERLCEYEKSKVRLGSVVAQAVADSVLAKAGLRIIRCGLPACTKQ